MKTTRVPTLVSRRRMVSRQRIRVVAVLVAVMTLTGVLGPVAPASAQGSTEATITFTGRGWGHGRGMGQYGALGYARDHGWNTEQILNHYYQGTHTATDPPREVRVELMAQQGKALLLNLPVGTFEVWNQAGAKLFESDARGLLITGNATDGFKWQSGPGCAGPWSEPAQPFPPTAVNEVIRVTDTNPADTDEGLIQVCKAAGTTSYAGELRLVDVDQPNVRGLRTVNVITIEEYLRGVVPREMPASWGDIAPAALRAQAVAARSYALSGVTGGGYRDLCDTIACQVYGGRYVTNGNGTTTSLTDSRSDAAIAATAGQVRKHGNGAIARTEYSSSTGGHTAGGTFPAVIDLGDAVSLNPNRTWTTDPIPTAAVEAEHKLGRLLEVVVLKRTGLSPHGDGGRVLEVELRFQNGNRKISGSQARIMFGLRSDWFTPSAVSRPDVEGTPIGNFVVAAYETYTGSPPGGPVLTTWHDRIVAGTARGVLTAELARSVEFAGVMIDDIYQRALGRGADAEGKAYWMDRVTVRGVPYAHLGTYFYGSAEYYQRNGATSVGFVTGLYRDLLEREPDSAGLTYWTGLLDGGRARLDDVAYGFYASLESRRSRADGLYRRILDRPADAAGRDLAAARIAQVGDLVVAAELGASEEFFQKAQR